MAINITNWLFTTTIVVTRAKGVYGHPVAPLWAVDGSAHASVQGASAMARPQPPAKSVAAAVCAGCARGGGNGVRDRGSRLLCQDKLSRPPVPTDSGGRSKRTSPLWSPKRLPNAVLAWGGTKGISYPLGGGSPGCRNRALSLEWIECVHAACGADSTINWRGTLEVRERKFLSVTSVMKRPTHVPVQSFFLTAITCLRGRFE